VLSDEERRMLHEGVCPRHRDDVPGVYVCGPCERAGDAAVERIVARHVEAVRADLVGRIEALAEAGYELVRFYGESCETCHTQWQASGIALLALLPSSPAAGGSEEREGEALEACREQRTDLLELLAAEREAHAEAIVKAWHEGYGAGSSDATDGWLQPGSPRTACPYTAPVVAPEGGGRP
jgi:hypothetical protein